MFEDIHPGETAGDGKAIRRSTSYKPGDRVVEIIRCAQCGMFFREGIDSEGPSQDAPGVNVSPVTVTVSANNDKLPQPLKNMTKFQNGAQIKRSNVTVVAGCRLCGTMNPRGAQRNNRDYQGGPDASNR